MPTHITTLELTAEQKELRARFNTLKKEFSELFALKNEMLSHKGPFLTSLYLELIGRKLYEHYCLKVELSKLKERMTLLQVYINRNESPDLQAVDEKIEILFSEYQKKIEEEAQNLAAAREYLTNGKFLSDEEVKELKSLYYTIVKWLHPDINPDLTEEQKELFVKAQAAYELLDLNTLRLILVSLEIGKLYVTDSLNLEEMVEKLIKNIDGLKAQIDKMNLEFPFIFKEKIHNQEWVKSEQKEIQKEIDALIVEIEKYKQYVILLEEWKPEFQN